MVPAVQAIDWHTRTGQWTGWLHQVPALSKVGFSVFIIVWIAFVLVRNRLARLQDRDSGVVIATSSPFQKRRLVAKQTYAGVSWRVVGVSSSILQHRAGLPPDYVEVEIPPRCPECETELEERSQFVRGYTWICPACQFQKKSANSFDVEADRAEKVARRQWEIDLEKRSS